MNVLIMEYPGYGIYYGNNSVGQIFQDAENIFNYLVINLQQNPTNIVVYGYYFGTGPAIHLASKYQLGLLILDSPFKDINQLIN